MAETDLSGTVLDGRYQVIEPIAEGAMGSVYRGERLKLGRAVAIKVMHQELPDELASRQRFEREAKLMALLEHPNCVSVIDFGLHEEKPFLVMDFIRGTSLIDVMDKQGRLDVARSADIIRQVLSGLAHAHELGIVHRDIKPANIMISEKAGLGQQVRILDFGLARLQEATGTKLTTGIVVGTPNYMAPEQCKGGDIDARTDLYACGVMLFEMLTGRKPFLADDPIQVVRKHLMEKPPTMASIEPNLDFGDLEAVVARALSKAPADRFASAVDMAKAVEVAANKATKMSAAALFSRAVPETAPPIGNQQATMSGWTVPGEGGATSQGQPGSFYPPPAGGYPPPPGASYPPPPGGYPPPPGASYPPPQGTYPPGPPDRPTPGQWSPPPGAMPPPPPGALPQVSPDQPVAAGQWSPGPAASWQPPDAPQGRAGSIPPDAPQGRAGSIPPGAAQTPPGGTMELSNSSLLPESAVIPLDDRTTIDPLHDRTTIDPAAMSGTDTVRDSPPPGRGLPPLPQAAPYTPPPIATGRPATGPAGIVPSRPGTGPAATIPSRPGTGPASRPGTGPAGIVPSRPGTGPAGIVPSRPQTGPAATVSSDAPSAASSGTADAVDSTATVPSGPPPFAELSSGAPDRSMGLPPTRPTPAAPSSTSDARPIARLPLSKKQLIIAAAGLVAVVLVIVLVAGRSSKTTTARNPGSGSTIDMDEPKSDPVPQIVERANGLIASEDYDEAVSVLKRGRKANPDNAQLAFLSGKANFGRLWWTDGIDDFREAIKLDDGYKENQDLLKTVLKGFLTTPDTDDRIVEFMREIGPPLRPLLEETAEKHPKKALRARARAELNASP